MELSSYKDIEAPIDWVFAQLTDFESFERQAMRRGASVRRIDDTAGAGRGAAWEARFLFRGKERVVRADLTGFDPPSQLVVDATSPGIQGALQVDLLALSRNRTRLTVALTITPKTLGMRLLLQSMRLARGNVARQFDARIGSFASDLQDRARRAQVRTGT